jgi:hypothetical protein
MQADYKIRMSASMAVNRNRKGGYAASKIRVDFVVMDRSEARTALAMEPTKTMGADERPSGILPSRQDTAITEASDQALGRAQRRLLRRIYNGRTVPIIANGRPFLTYREASAYLLSLAPDAREQACAQMRSGAANGAGGQA